jgi:hypothetical protein
MSTTLTPRASLELAVVMDTFKEAAVSLLRQALFDDGRSLNEVTKTWKVSGT